MAKILIIDDEENIRKTLREILQDESYEVVLAESAAKGLVQVREERPDVVLLDIRLPDGDGVELLERIKKGETDCEVVMISGHATIDAAIRSIKLGAYHFLQKPLTLIDVKQTVRHALQVKAQRDKIRALSHDGDERYKMIGHSRMMNDIRTHIAKVAPTEGRVLITGESGTGKELIAYWIHRQSSRSQNPFIRINCAAIPVHLIESELFGHEKGSFTGALNQKIGKFEAAHEGTLFLDEVGDMDMNTQTKVLRVLQEGEFERVGGLKTIKINVRVIAATHRNLEEMIQEGRFREDLFYRLNVIPIRAPNLTERREDISVLARHFLSLYCLENNLPEKHFSDEALSALSGHVFRGNIRELRNMVERCAILVDKTEIGLSDLSSFSAVRQDSHVSLFIQSRPLYEAKLELEKQYVRTQLEQNGWDIPKPAGLLDLHRTNLHRKIRLLGIEKQ